MSRSYRTQKREVIAKRNILERSKGKPNLPRLVERKPRSGDSHPITKKYLRGALLNLPIEYLYGLRKIELLPRSAEVGSPYALYRPGEKSIQLYSQPMTWSTNNIDFSYAKRLRDHWDAEVDTQEDTTTISWPSRERRELWFFMEVLMHQLGHHYQNQYRTRDKLTHYKTENMVAHLHWIRFYRRKLRALRAKEDALASST